MSTILPPGLQRAQLEHIAKAGAAVRKVSRRDLPHVVAARGDGATTVSATMLLAARAGIRVFVTGGIGGVHRWGHAAAGAQLPLGAAAFLGPPASIPMRSTSETPSPLPLHPPLHPPLAP